MPRSYPVPLQQTWPSLATRKRNAAVKRAAEAERLFREADELDRRWVEYRDKHWPREAAS